MNLYKDKVCVITGAASGMGRAMAIKLAGAGASLALCDVNEAGLAETLEMCGGPASNRIITDIVDMADGDAIKAYAKKTEATLGPADYVFNNAGLSRVGTFEHTPLDSFEKVIDVNLYGVVRMCKAYFEQIKAQRGKYVNVSSVFGMIGYPGQTHYCASKFGVRGFSETLAQEVEPLGMKVCSVHPGGVATNVARNAQIDHNSTGKTRDEMNADFDKAARTSPEKAADIILRGAARGKRRIMIGFDSRLISLAYRLFPKSYDRVLGLFMPRKVLGRPEESN